MRQTVVSRTAVGSGALEQARQWGRDEATPLIEGLRGKVARLAQRSERWRSEAEWLAHRLAGAPEELLVAVRDVLDGHIGAKTTAVRCWSLIDSADRAAHLPILAALADERVDRWSTSPLTLIENLDEMGDLVERILWLSTLLTLHSGRTAVGAGALERLELSPLARVHRNACERMESAAKSCQRFKDGLESIVGNGTEASPTRCPQLLSTCGAQFDGPLADAIARDTGDAMPLSQADARVKSGSEVPSSTATVSDNAALGRGRDQTLGRGGESGGDGAPFEWV